MTSLVTALPFLSIFSVSIFLLIHKVMPNQPWLSYIFLFLSITGFAGWAFLSKEKLLLLVRRNGLSHGFSSFLSIGLSFVLIVGLAFLTSRPNFNKSWDVTENAQNTLSDQSTKIINLLLRQDQQVEVVGFFLDPIKKDNFQKILSLYQQAGARFSVEYVDPQEDPTRAITENVTTADTVLFKLGSRELRLTSFSEEKVTNVLLGLHKNKTKRIAFSIGHSERDPNSEEVEGMRLLAMELESERYALEEINFLEKPDLDPQIDLIAIIGPQYDFREEELSVLGKYLDSAVPLLVLLDALVDLPNLHEFLNEYGFSVNQDMVVIHPSNPLANQPNWQYSALVTDFDPFSPVTKDFAERSMMAMVMPFARSLEINEKNKYSLDVSSLAKASDVNIRYSGVRTSKDLEDIKQEQILPGDKDIILSGVVLLGGDKFAKLNDTASKPDASEPELVNSNKELRMVVGGSSHFISNYGAQRIENLDMFLNIVSYLTQDEDFISIRPKDLAASDLDLASVSSQFNLVFFSFIYPFIFLGLGVFNWFMRRRI